MTIELDQGVYDKMETLFDLGLPPIPVKYPRDILFTGDGASAVGQISSFRRLNTEHNLVMNLILVAENHQDPCSHAFMFQTAILTSLLRSATERDTIDARGPGTILFALLEGSKGISIGPKGSNSFGVFLFTLISKPGADPRDEIRELGPIFVEAGILTPAQGMTFLDNIDQGPLRGPIDESTSGSKQTPALRQ